jgi:ferredoxin-NADP reductase
MATPIKFLAEVTHVVMHGDDVATYEFRCPGRRPRYKPGQFLHLALDEYDPSGHWPESRVFTIAKGATDREFIRLTIAEKGRFTARVLQELVVGKQVWLKAPYGKFIVRPEPDGETALIAGGTGVAPFVAFMEDAFVNGMKGDVWLHYGARRSDLLVFREVADRCAETFPNFHVKYYLEEEETAGAIPGRIDIEEACRSLRNVGNAIFYLCGPPVMVETFCNRLKDTHGVQSENIRVDDWE